MEAAHDNPTRNTLVIGGGSCGKTSFAVRYLINVPWTCAFIFDLQGQFAHRLGQKWVGTAAECDAALSTGFVCLNPYRMFEPHRTDDAFNWFAGWAYDVSVTAPGRKILVADDSWEFSAARVLTPELAKVTKIGRFRGLEFMGVTHRPKEYNVAVRSLVTEWVVFNSRSADLDEVKTDWPGITAATTLPKFEFLSFNRDTGIEWRAKLPPP